MFLLTTPDFKLQTSNFKLFILHPMIKHTQHFLDKLTGILAASNYYVRNEKGNFKSGHCLKENSRVILLNKNAPVESKINFLCEVLRKINVDEPQLSSDDRKLIAFLRQTELFKEISD